MVKSFLLQTVSVLCCTCGGGFAFQPTVFASRKVFSPIGDSSVWATKGSGQSGKGFGTRPTDSSTPKVVGETDAQINAKIEPDVDSTVDGPRATMEQDRAAKKEKPMTAGRRALQRMRQEQAEKKDVELRKVREIRDVDRSLRENPGAAAIPEKVAMRMGQRALPFVGIPLLGNLAAFVAFWYLATYQNMEYETSMVAFTTIGILAVGLIGITYSILSTSWDEDREGDFLGLDEFQRNVQNLKDGLSRSQENALIRERMAGLDEQEIVEAIEDLNKRDAAKLGDQP